MGIKRILKFVEVAILISLVISPIFFFTTSLSIEFRGAKIGFKEGDIIQITISDFSFDYNITVSGNYSITPGIYLNPIIDFKEGVSYLINPEDVSFSNIKLFEGNSSSNLQYRVRIDSINKKKTIANVSIENSNRRFSLGLFDHFKGAIIPFFEPSLGIGLTFRLDKGTDLISYVHWRSVHIFPTRDYKEALNWHGKNDYVPPFDFAKENSRTYNRLYASTEFLSLTTYRLSYVGKHLNQISSIFEGNEIISIGHPFFSNITIYLGIPAVCYWNYRLTLEYQFYRGSKEIWI